MASAAFHRPGSWIRWLAALAICPMTGCHAFHAFHCWPCASLGKPIARPCTSSSCSSPCSICPTGFECVECEPFCEYTLHQWPWGEWHSFRCIGQPVVTAYTPLCCGQASKTPQPPTPQPSKHYRHSEPLPMPPAAQPKGEAAKENALLSGSGNQASQPGMILPVSANLPEPQTPNPVQRITGSSTVILKVIELADPVLAGSEVDYVIQISNRDALPACDLSLRLECLQGLKPVRIVNAFQPSIEGQTVTVRPFDLAPFGTKLFRLKTQAVKAGDTGLRVTLSGPNLKAEIIEEAGTRILGQN